MVCYMANDPPFATMNHAQLIWESGGFCEVAQVCISDGLAVRSDQIEAGLNPRYFALWEKRDRRRCDSDVSAARWRRRRMDQRGAGDPIACRARRYKRWISGNGATIMIGARDWGDGADGIARSGPVRLVHGHRNDGGRRRGHEVSQKKGLRPRPSARRRARLAGGNKLIHAVIAPFSSVIARLSP
jgi:hypothetical protein